jgi:signal transduction histidine kinase
VNRLHEFLRGHPTRVDGFWAFVLLVLSGLWLTGSGTDHLIDQEWQRIAGLPITVALGTVVTLRRRFPEHMLLLATAAGLAQMAAGVFVLPANFAMLVIIFTVASRPVVWASRYALVGAFAAPTLCMLRFPEEERGTVSAIPGTVLMTVCFLLAWVLGDSLRTRRAYYAQLEERAARLEREREACSKAAVAAERARIVRELHDVVAHNVSVMVVQADGAAYALNSAPEQARQALETISGTGRQALAEMRRLLDVLRTGEKADRGGEYVPQPGVEQLADLVEQVRGAGLPVEFRIEGTPRPLPSGVELTAYRIVQEALSNTRKHGGPDAGATVRLAYGDRELSLLAEDDGCGVQQEPDEACGTGRQGHGLIGMRERIGMVGGVLEAGPRPGGGFRISAALPLKGAG